MQTSNLIGQVLAHRFRVDTFIGAGGMGVVYKVWDIQRNVFLAMKVLHGDLLDNPVVFRHFQREAESLRRLTHPNIVPFYGVYEDQDLPFLLEGFINGPTLKDILRGQHGRPLPLRDAMAYLRALCASLGYAHTMGIVHCDVKPGNVMVDASGAIYLTDFGIARYIEGTLTTLGPAGTPAYMAPEQIRGEALTPPAIFIPWACCSTNCSPASGLLPVILAPNATARPATTHCVRHTSTNLPLTRAQSTLTCPPVSQTSSAPPWPRNRTSATPPPPRSSWPPPALLASTISLTGSLIP